MMKPLVDHDLVLLYTCEEERGFFRWMALIRVYNRPHIEVESSFRTDARLPSQRNTNGSVTPFDQPPLEQICRKMKRDKKSERCSVESHRSLAMRVLFYFPCETIVN